MSLHYLQLTNQLLVYQQRRRSGQRSLRLTVLPGAKVIISAPRLISQNRIERFIRSKEKWLLEKMLILKNKVRPQLESAAAYKEHKTEALQIIQERLLLYNQHYRFVFKKVMIRNQSTRWGSCSKKGNLNFNFRLIHLPAELRDYVIVHELCHLKEMNHSARFWKLVAEIIPDYKARQKELRKIGKTLF